MPSEATTLIGRAVDGAETILNRQLFSGIISSANAVTEIPRTGNGTFEFPVKMPPVSSVIITSILIQTSASDQTVYIRLGPENISSLLEPGEWIVTIVLSGPKHVEYGRDYIAFPYMLLSGCRKKKACTVTLKRWEEGSALSIIKRIVGELYEESTSGD